MIAHLRDRSDALVRSGWTRREDARVFEAAAEPARGRRPRRLLYNFVRPHGSLDGMTPAMALGIAETFWPVERLLP